ncbi:MAG: copper resistance protein CopC, partial [Chloroflexi bacterium]|nr:copper resistance protein CopC [Chloroflexota bacterium]
MNGRNLIRVVALGLGLLLAAAWPAPAAAHAELVSASPPPGAQLTEPPTELRLVFSESLGPNSGLTLFGQGFREVESLQAQVSPQEPAVLVAPLSALPPDTYTVQWTVSSLDGHPASGSYSFSLLAAPVAGPGGAWGWLVLAFLYALLVWLVATREAIEKRITPGVVLYLLLAAIWMAGLWAVARWNGFAGRLTAGHLSFYALPLLAAVFLYLSHVLLQRRQVPWLIWLPGLLAFIAFALLDTNALALPEILWTGLGRIFPRQDVAAGLAVLSWATFTILNARPGLRAYRQSIHRPLHLNRLVYWLISLTLLLVGDGLVFLGTLDVGVWLHLPPVALITYAALVYDLVDLRRLLRRALTYVVVALLFGLLYELLLLAYQELQQRVSGPEFLTGLSLWLVAAVIALAVLLVSQPLLRLAEKGVDRLTAGAVYDPSRAVREYSLNISHIVDLEQLEADAVELISDAMQIRHGTLYLVNTTTGPDGQLVCHNWQSVHGYGELSLELGTLPAESPVAQHLRQERRPLTQFDVDVLPRFAGLAEAERAWLSGLGIEVYVPIHSKGEWVGLMGLGPKVSGDRYYDEDLDLLSTLADQTAVALQNARLVADLIHLNKDLKQAYADLEDASRRLQEMDKLKSAFIGVITHELRTPFANMGFSLQLMEKYGRDHLVLGQQEQLDQLAREVQSAKVMVDNLVTFAAFLRKQGELQPEWLSFDRVVEDALLPLKPLAANKGVTLYLGVPADLPELHADGERLMDAIHHLVHNAIKFTPAGGEIWVKSWLDGDSLHFEVEDTGVGVPA